MSIDISELRKLSNQEKLQIVEVLWNDIAASDEPISLTSDQLEELTRRGEEMKADPSIGIDRDELWRRVDG